MCNWVSRPALLILRFWSPAAVAGAADMFPSGRPLCLLFLYFFFFFLVWQILTLNI